MTKNPKRCGLKIRRGAMIRAFLNLFRHARDKRYSEKSVNAMIDATSVERFMDRKCHVTYSTEAINNFGELCDWLAAQSDHYRAVAWFKLGGCIYDYIENCDRNRTFYIDKERLK